MHGEVTPDAFHDEGKRSSGEKVPDEAQQGPERCPQTRLQHGGQFLNKSTVLCWHPLFFRKHPFRKLRAGNGYPYIYFSLVTLCAAR